MRSAWYRQRLFLALSISLGLHAFVLFGIGFALPDARDFARSLQPLQVVLVNSRSRMAPDQADALAQSNLDGGGNTEEDRRAKSPLPTTADGRRYTPEQAKQRARQLEQEAKRLLTQLKNSRSVSQEKKRAPQVEGASGVDMINRSLEIARLEAQINKDWDAYQKMPRRKFIGARTREYRFAQYVEDWRVKVERIGNLNYPEAARQQKVFGSLAVTVSIRADGSLENVEISRSSGKGLLDAAAMRIVRLSAPFSPFPPNIRRDTDVLSITRTWTFTEADKLESE